MAARRFLTQDAASAAAAPGTGADDAPPTAPHVRRWNLHGSAAKVAIAGNVVFAVLFFAAVVWRIFFSGRGQDDDDDAAPQAQAAQGADGAVVRPASSSATSTPPRAGGLRKDDLLALPVYVHGSTPGPEEATAGGGGGEGSAECAVCISELRDGDTGRILPRCGHRFHAECVDRWLRSHATCPLCRVVAAGDGSGKSYPKMQPAV